MIRFIYLGGGWYPGVPARNLSEDDLAQLDEEQLVMVQLGHLYQPAGPDRRHTEYDDELDLLGSDSTETIEE